MSHSEQINNNHSDSNNIDSILSIGQGLMIVAGADKEITPPEMDWLKNSWLTQFDNQDSIFDILVRFNYREEDKVNFFNQLKDKLSTKEKKKFIYYSIQMSSSDMIYSDEERECVKFVSEVFEIAQESLLAIESLKEMEDAVEITKNAILSD